jgi:hypothetical protein
VPALPSWLTDPLWDQFRVLLPDRGPYHRDHPLGCHRRPVDDRIVFDKLLQVLVFGCGYRKIADAACSATTIRDRRNQWIALGIFATLELLVLQAYDRMVGLALADLVVDGCIIKAPCGGQHAGRSPADRGKQGANAPPSPMAVGSRWARSAPAPTATTRRCLAAPWTPWCGWTHYHRSPRCTWMQATTAKRLASCSTSVTCAARSPSRAHPRRLLGDAELLQGRPQGYVLAVARGDLDMGQFERLVAQTRDAAGVGDRRGRHEEALACQRESLGIRRELANR